MRLLFFALVFIMLAVIIAVTVYQHNRNGLQMNVGGTDVVVKVGDIFEEEGLKVIPFDERFDTQVDDNIISKNSLNGIYIDQYTDKSLLEQAIGKLKEASSTSSGGATSGKRFPLGTVMPYGEYALLAFSAMDKSNNAHLSRIQYEECLFRMWTELNRVYAGKKIVLPLLGSGITRFDDGEISNDELLRCMLCTLWASRQNFRSGVEIVLTSSVADDMYLYKVKGFTDSWE